MGVRFRAKSANYYAAVEAGFLSNWLHIDAGVTGRITVVQAQIPFNPNVMKPIILDSVTINTSGASSALVLTDSATGVIASLKASVQEKDYHYTLPLRGNLLIDPNGSDVTINYVRD